MNFTRVWRGARRSGILLSYNLSRLNGGSLSLFKVGMRQSFSRYRRSAIPTFLALYTAMLVVPIPVQAAPLISQDESDPLPYAESVIFRDGEVDITQSQLNLPQAGISKYEEQARARQEKQRLLDLEQHRRVAALQAVTRSAPVNLSAIQIQAKVLTEEAFGPGQYDALFNLIQRESGWNPQALNRYSGAYGLGQALPAQKMTAYGRDWRDNPDTQLRWLMGYIKARYESPVKAWSFWLTYHWY